jgi:hypothetical protein
MHIGCSRDVGWETFLFLQRLMWVTTIAASVRLADVRDECLGVLKLDLEGCK